MTALRRHLQYILFGTVTICVSMMCRLTELIILNIAKTIGVFDERTFTVLVLMAVTGTILVSPVRFLFD